jgi:hypothetical protein
MQRLVDPVGGDLLDALREPREVHGGQGRRGRLVALVDPDDEHAPVDRELGEVLRQFLVGRLAGRQLALEFEGMPLVKKALREHAAQLTLVGWKPDHPLPAPLLTRSSRATPDGAGWRVPEHPPAPPGRSRSCGWWVMLGWRASATTNGSVDGDGPDPAAV